MQTVTIVDKKYYDELKHLQKGKVIDEYDKLIGVVSRINQLHVNIVN